MQAAAGLALGGGGSPSSHAEERGWGIVFLRGCPPGVQCRVWGMAFLLGKPAFRSIPAPAGTKVVHPIGRVGPRWGYLAEEGENALVLLKELGDGEAATLDAPQRVEEQVSVEGALALLGPHVDLLLMVGEGAVIPVLTVLLVYHVCKEATATFRQAGGQPVGPPSHPQGHSATQFHPSPWDTMAGAGAGGEAGEPVFQITYTDAL